MELLIRLADTTARFGTFKQEAGVHVWGGEVGVEEKAKTFLVVDYLCEINLTLDLATMFGVHHAVLNSTNNKTYTIGISIIARSLPIKSWHVI